MERQERYICVIGASNWDMFTYCDRIPVIGETIKGTDFKVSFGGKAANQAVQASLLNTKSLGDDVFGNNTLNNFKIRGVSVEHVNIVPGVPSGCASITVDKEGSNNIIIVGGSNDLLGEQDVIEATKTIQNASYLLCQLEVNLKTTLKALSIAKESKCKTILNVSPVTNDTEMLMNMLGCVDILIVNEVELIKLSNDHQVDVENLESVHHGARELLRLHIMVSDVIVTLGAKGCVLVNRLSIDKYQHIKHRDNATMGKPVVDTTGAGDSFIGALAHYLTTSMLPLAESIERACNVAAICVTRYGTQTSYATFLELSPEDQI
ncbi:hypothetical protein PPL_04547 [Heterostelium album PN500]|uniref:Ribokinase n=1 Tax=Heterostelium pallidum (strain ATCC 26659 / Pp 5 / PN500) TaxID=670386 RepID=D3B7V9_HETP5|nr:hypothetical protein PPL_04547 [Heterostelium album PN500]EFA82852.1 hypothetical protein PPL_04547 [Heterostelium album PN500]|eukprot:XP_020434969.1 hypothetical protein PPL_04547 [Heterostelium album PN500]